MTYGDGCVFSYSDVRTARDTLASSVSLLKILNIEPRVPLGFSYSEQVVHPRVNLQMKASFKNF